MDKNQFTVRTISLMWRRRHLAAAAAPWLPSRSAAVWVDFSIIEKMEPHLKPFKNRTGIWKDD